MAEAKTMAIVPHAPKAGGELYRTSTDAAGMCKDIVVKTAMNIQGRKYVKVEGWQSIAIAHGCFASAGEVERITDEGGAGYRAIGKVIRASDGQVLTTAEGFVGDDEKMWGKRDVYAKRAMAQTRAISRACRSAFAHVVVMMDAGLETTPAEEVPREGFDGHAPEGPLEEKLKASVDHLAAQKKAKAAAKAIADQAEILEGEIVPADGFLMPFRSNDGHWEKGAPISSLKLEHVEGLAKWKPKKPSDVPAAAQAELARRAAADPVTDPGLF